MASNINPTNIDITYPIAGQDNDTKGFRDNFTSIKNNFTTAASEITALQAVVSTTTKNASVPASHSDTGTPGQIACDTNYLYVYVSAGRWVRIAVDSSSW